MSLVKRLTIQSILEHWLNHHLILHLLFKVQLCLQMRTCLLVRGRSRGKWTEQTCLLHRFRSCLLESTHDSIKSILLLLQYLIGMDKDTNDRFRSCLTLYTFFFGLFYCLLNCQFLVNMFWIVRLLFSPSIYIAFVDRFYIQFICSDFLSIAYLLLFFFFFFIAYLCQFMSKKEE